MDRKDGGSNAVNRVVVGLLTRRVSALSSEECVRTFATAKLRNVPPTSFHRPKAPHLSAETRVRRLTQLCAATTPYHDDAGWRQWIDELLRCYVGVDGVLVYAVGVLTAAEGYGYLRGAPAELRLNIAQHAYELCARMGKTRTLLLRLRNFVHHADQAPMADDDLENCVARRLAEAHRRSNPDRIV